MTAIPNTRFAVFVLQFSLNPPKNNATRKSAKPEKADNLLHGFSLLQTNMIRKQEPNRGMDISDIFAVSIISE